MDPNDRAAPSSAAHAPSTRVRPVLEHLIATTRRHWGRLSQRSEVQLRDYGGAAFEDRLQERLAPHQRAQGLRFEDTLAPAGRCERVPEDGMLIWIELEGLDAIRHGGDGSAVDELRALVCERISAYMEGSGDPIGCYGFRSFVCLHSPIGSRERAAAFVEGLLKVLSTPCRSAGAPVRLRPILGVACFPGDGTNATILLMHAAAAMRRARRLGSGHAFHSPLLDAAFATLPSATTSMAPNWARVGAVRSSASTSAMDGGDRVATERRIERDDSCAGRRRIESRATCR